jgi:hypothetical protein
VARAVAGHEGQVARRATSLERDSLRRQPYAAPVRLYRYFFYGWMFRDTDLGSDWERAAAARHNQIQAKWLPTYMFRWLIAGSVVVAIERVVELALQSPVWAALLCVVIVGVVIFELVTAVAWAFLRAEWRP